MATDTARWSTVAQVAPPWDQRNVQIAALIRPGAAVLDIGAGSMTLRGYLREPRRYVPMDCVSTSPETVVCDLNTPHVPFIAVPFDYAVLSGVLEHVDDVQRTLALAAWWANEIIFSYCLVETADPEIVSRCRRKLRCLDLLQILGRLGLFCHLADTWNGQAIFRARKGP